MTDPATIAKGLTPYLRATILRLADGGPLTIKEACPTINRLPSIMELVRWSGEYRHGAPTYELTDLGRAVAAALQEVRAAAAHLRERG